MRVAVGMSGGVDSSVAALLLQRQGHDVFGITMRLHPSDAPEGGCCSPDAVRDAAAVCDLLGIDHYALPFRDSFEREVVGPFRHAYAMGLTPNPCVACNDRVKFMDLLKRALSAGADALATGHYARIARSEDGSLLVARGKDERKDQSYFLYRMTDEVLRRVLFPLGDLTKAAVRESAREAALPVAAKGESHEVCFVPDDDYASFVAEAYPHVLRPGPIVDVSGRRVGTHAGIARYTVGQRKGLGGGATGRRYVIALRPETNEIVVGGLEDLEVSELVLDDVVWHGARRERVGVQVRYRQAAVPAEATMDAEGTVIVRTEVPLRGAAPGQSVVCYRDDSVIGGGVLRETS